MGDKNWKLCVDFTDINKACPKDCYPLPTDDQKIEYFAKLWLKCFLDAYKGYQRLIDTIFSNQIRQNLEVHVDDMVIKSDTKEDIQETFNKLREINMKLNLKKCSFDVEEGPFLGYLSTKQGSKLTPQSNRLDTSFSKGVEELCKLEDSLMDAGGRRSLPGHEGVHRNITHDHNPNQRRNPGNVPSSLRRKYKCSSTCRKKKEENLHLFRKPSTKRGRNGVSRAGKTHTSPRICRKKALAVLPSSPYPDTNGKPIKLILARPKKSRRIAK
ncbi:hypothetical protein Tco_0016483 [Tanacetum coccineum]